MNNLKNIQGFSRTPENIQGQQDVFQESRTQRVLIANSRTSGNLGSPPLKPTKVTLFTMVLHNSEYSIGDIGPCCPQLVCHRNVVKQNFISLAVVNP